MFSLTEQQLFVDVLREMTDDIAKILLQNHTTLGVQIHFLLKWREWKNQLKAMPQIELELPTNRNFTLPDSSNESNLILSNVQNRISLSNILHNNHESRLILQYANRNNNKLNEGIRQMLVDTICNYFIRHNLPLSVDDCDAFSNQIVKTFADEQKVFFNFV